MSPHIYQLIIKSEQTTENTAAWMVVYPIAGMYMLAIFCVLHIQIFYVSDEGLSIHRFDLIIS